MGLENRQEDPQGLIVGMVCWAFFGERESDTSGGDSEFRVRSASIGIEIKVINNAMSLYAEGECPTVLNAKRITRLIAIIPWVGGRLGLLKR